MRKLFILLYYNAIIALRWCCHDTLQQWQFLVCWNSLCVSAASVQEENVVELRRTKPLNLLCSKTKKDKRAERVKHRLSKEAECLNGTVFPHIKVVRTYRSLRSGLRSFDSGSHRVLSGLTSCRLPSSLSSPLQWFLHPHPPWGTDKEISSSNNMYRMAFYSAKIRTCDLKKFRILES